MQINRATRADIPAIQRMADVVFRQTYAAILTPAQLDYMMEWMYSTASLTDQIEAEGKDFFIAIEKGEPVGYVSIEEEGKTEEGHPLVHLQKLYVMPQMQGTGLGRRLFEHVKELLLARYPDGCRIELNVNRANPAVNFYEKMGMHRDRQGDFPIGNNYYMNDYIYALPLPSR